MTYPIKPEVQRMPRAQFIAASADAILARAGVLKSADGSPFRGMSLLDLARASLLRAGESVADLAPMDIVARGFTQSTSDFPVLLENTMHRALQKAYAVAPDTWSRWCSIGSVKDFRAHPRYRPSSFGNLEFVPENGELKNRAIRDAEKASITAGTKGNIINLSRQAIINDDLTAFTDQAAALGRAAKRSIEADAIALLASNPLMSDGVAFFHASHGNLLTTGALPTMASIEEARVAMASQKDVGGNDYIENRPAVWLGPTALVGYARGAFGAEFNDDSNRQQRKPNAVRNLVREIIETPRLPGSAWYLIAEPNETPAIEVAFLDGQQDPVIESRDGFTIDGVQWRVRLDYGVAPIDWRGAAKNVGV